MNKETIIEIIKKLTGEINPVADASIDRDRIENLKLFLEVFDEMHSMICDIEYYWKDSKYGSVFPFVEACKKQFKNIGIEEE